MGSSPYHAAAMWYLKIKTSVEIFMKHSFSTFWKSMACLGNVSPKSKPVEAQSTKLIKRCFLRASIWVYMDTPRWEVRMWTRCYSNMLSSFKRHLLKGRSYAWTVHVTMVATDAMTMTTDATTIARTMMTTMTTVTTMTIAVDYEDCHEDCLV